MNRFIIFTILFTFYCAVEGRLRSCTATTTECKPLNGCEPLKELFLKDNRTPQEDQKLREAACGNLNRQYYVCCPKTVVGRPLPPTRPPVPPPTQLPTTRVAQPECHTPHGKPGQCVSLSSCKSIQDMLAMKPQPEFALSYARSSICSAELRTICCSTDPIDMTSSIAQCNAIATASPPDPTSKCCGSDSRYELKIAGGGPTNPDEYPWLALIEYRKNGITTTKCGGSLISARYVLTAAHCLLGKVITDYGRPTHVRLGEYNITNEGPDCVVLQGVYEDCTDGAQRIEIERTIYHKEYSFTHNRNDIGLIRLKQNAPYTSFIRPICLPTEDITLKGSFNTTVAGWGKMGRNLGFSPVKLHVALPFVALDECQTYFTKSRVTLWERQLCAGGERGKDSCGGDSGGPLMYALNNKYTLVGVVSFGDDGCGAENIPGVYTKVYDYLPWIRSKIQI